MEAVVKKENVQEIQQVQETAGSVSPLVAMLASGQLQSDHVEQAMKLQAQHDGYEARKAYNIDMAKAKAEMGVAIKSQKNDFVGSSYANLSDLIKATGPALSKYGFNWSWKVDSSEKGFITANCNMTHRLGHCETFPCRLPDAIVITSKKGTTVNNPAQAAGSARTYAKRYSFEDAVGIASQDDDGQAITQQAPVIEYISESDMADIEAVLTEVGGSMEKWSAFQVRLLGAATGGIPLMPKTAKASAIKNIRKTAEKRAAEAVKNQESAE